MDEYPLVSDRYIWEATDEVIVHDMWASDRLAGHKLWTGPAFYTVGRNYYWMVIQHEKSKGRGNLDFWTVYLLDDSPRQGVRGPLIYDLLPEDPEWPPMVVAGFHAEYSFQEAKAWAEKEDSR